LETSANGFTLPSGAFSASGSTYTATFAGYPYFKQTNYRKNLDGHVYLGGAPAGTITKTAKTAAAGLQYPSASVTTSPPGFIRVKPGSFGGAIPVSRATVYDGIFAGGAGYYNFGFFWGANQRSSWQVANGGIVAPAIYGDSSEPIGYPFIASTGQHTSIPGLSNAAAGVANPVVKFFTGTVTVSAPSPFEATYAVATGMDNRTAAGQSGSIQLVSARRIMYFTLATVPPPWNGTGGVQSQRSGSGGIYRFALEFVPEPTQIALLATGILGLGVILRVRRS
jgi:hypothetical protein